MPRKKESAHGMTNTPEYRSWTAMRCRCLSEHHEASHRYKGRGITICDRWSEFLPFFEDMGNRPEGTTLDRIDNDKGYFKENCRWATMKEQQNNRRGLKLITFKGQTMTIQNWGNTIGMSPNNIASRLRKGWSVEDALTVRFRMRNSQWLPIWNDKMKGGDLKVLKAPRRKYPEQHSQHHLLEEARTPG